MTRSALTTSDSEAVEAATSPIISGLDDLTAKLAQRYADKWARWKRGQRSTGPHAHGLDKATRHELQDAVRHALGLEQASADAA